MCFYLHQVLLGLQHAHEKGMVHRDLKPENLIVARDGKKYIVKILDFGLAKARSEGETQADLTGAGKMLGTPTYTAPEQWRDAARADIRADIYSLGCTLYFLLAGRVPFKGASLIELWEAHQSVTAQPLNEVRPEIPAALSAVVAKMMAKDPAKRHQTPIEVAQDLLPFLNTTGQGSSMPQVISQPLPKPPDNVDTDRRETVIEGRSTIDGACKRLPTELAQGQLTSPRIKRKWLLMAGGTVAMLLLVLFTLSMGGVFKKGEPTTVDPRETKRWQVPSVMRFTGDWRIQGEELFQLNQEDIFSEIQFGDPSWTDYDFYVEALRERGNELLEVNCRCNGPKSKYMFQVTLSGNTKNGIGTWADEKYESIRNGPFRLENNRWYKVLLKARKNHFEADLNGTNVFTFDDNRHPRGRVGLCTFQSLYRFRNIKVTAPDGAVLWSELPKSKPNPSASTVAPEIVNRVAQSSPNKRGFSNGLGDWKIVDDELIGQRAAALEVLSNLVDAQLL